MPQLAVAAAAWLGSAVLTVTGSGTLAAATANFVAAAGFASGVGSAIGAWSTIGAVASFAAGKPKIGDLGKGTQVDFKADPNAGIPYIVGRTGVGGQIVRATTAADKNHLLCYLTVHSLGPVHQRVGFKANGKPVTFVADNAVEAPYHNMMNSRFELGSHTPAEFQPGAVPPGGMPEWTSAHKLTGLAKHWLVLAYDKNAKTYPTGTPKPLTIYDGVLVYDPRLDSEYPGGSGTCRPGQEHTYVFSDNPFLHALTYAIGRFQNGRRVMGVGALVDWIDVPAFVEGANVCDANGWKAGGVVYSTDDKWEVFKAMLQAGGGYPVSAGAKISCGVLAPKVSLATMTGADAVGDVEITAAQSKRARYNAGIPTYRSADHDYQLVPAAKISVPAYLAEDDGAEHVLPAEFPLVPAVDQAAQLMTYAIANSREFGPVTVPALPKWARFRGGDCFTINEPEWGLNGQKVVVVTRRRDWRTGGVTLTLMSETDGKHPFALGKTGAPPPTPGLTGIDGAYVPPAGEDVWFAVGTTLAGPGGELPVIRVTGAADAELISAIIVDYRELLSEGPPPVWGDWVTLEFPPSTTEINITGVKPLARYQVRIRYRSARGVEDPDTGTDLGVHQPGAINAGGVLSLSGAEIEAAVALGQQTVERLQAAIADANRTAEAVTMSALRQQKVIDALKRLGYTPEGLPTGAFASEQKVRTDTLVQDVSLIGIRSEDGTVFDLSQTTLKLDGELLAERINVLYAADADALAQISAEQSARISADGAFTTQLDALTTTVGNNQSTVLAQLSTQATDLSALATELHLLGAKNGAGTAFVFDLNKAEVSPGVSFGSRLSGIDTALSNNSAAIANEQTARINADGAFTSQLSTLSSTVGGHTATLSAHAGTLASHDGKLQAWMEIVAAAGSDPAYLKMMANSYGSSIMLAASAIALFNTAGGNVLKVMEVVGGNAYFSRVILIDAGSKRLALGPAFGTSSDLVLWFGPSSTAIGSMTKTNGHWAFGTDGKVYYGTGELGSGGSGGMTVGISAGIVSTAGTTTGSITATGTGGTAPYSYTWIKVSDSSTDLNPSCFIKANSPTSQSTTFTLVGGNPAALGEWVQATFLVTATDANGQSASRSVAARFTA